MSTRKFYDVEHDEILTLDELKISFKEDLTEEERDEFGGNFWKYLEECTGKNGTLEELV
jgi:hypothetical protein